LKSKEKPDGITIITCDRCNGCGEVYKNKIISCSVCPKCDGEGTLDWIDNILGKKKNDPSMRYIKKWLKEYYQKRSEDQ